MTWRLGTVGFTLAIACLMAPNVDAGDGKSYSKRDVEGPTAFDFDGFVRHPISGLRVPAASSGRFVADGRGNILDGERTLVIEDLPVLHQEFTCTYEVNPNGTGNADCTIVGVLQHETFDFVIVERKKEAYFTSTAPPNSILRGRTKRQH